jgi:hypothetical protein
MILFSIYVNANNWFLAITMLLIVLLFLNRLQTLLSFNVVVLLLFVNGFIVLVSHLVIVYKLHLLYLLFEFYFSNETRVNLVEYLNDYLSSRTFVINIFIWYTYTLMSCKNELTCIL